MSIIFYDNTLYSNKNNTDNFWHLGWVKGYRWTFADTLAQRSN